MTIGEMHMQKTTTDVLIISFIIFILTTRFPSSALLPTTLFASDLCVVSTSVSGRQRTVLPRRTEPAGWRELSAVSYTG